MPCRPKGQDDEAIHDAADMEPEPVHVSQEDGLGLLQLVQHGTDLPQLARSKHWVDPAVFVGEPPCPPQANNT